jgi:hypothetical protein
MEDDLNKNKKWKTTSKLRRKTTSKKEKGRRPETKNIKKLETTLHKEMEDDPPKNEKWKTTS